MGQIAKEFEKYCDIINKAKDDGTPAAMRDALKELPPQEAAFKKAMAEVGDGKRDAIDKLTVKAYSAWEASIEMGLDY